MATDKSKISKSSIISSPENVYYDVTQPNLTASYIQASFQETRQQPYLTNTEDWEVAITQFSIPSSSLPIFRFEPPFLGPPIDYSQGYWITIIAPNGVQFSSPINFNPAQAQNLNSAPILTGPNAYLVFNYTLFITQINIAFNALWTSLIAAGALPVGSQSPFIWYYPDTQLFKLYVDYSLYAAPFDPYITYYNGNNYATSVKIFFNYKLQDFFFFPAQYQNISGVLSTTTPLDYNLLFINSLYIPYEATNNQFVLFTVPVAHDLLELPQEYSTIGLWAQYTRILFFTNNLPVYEKQIGDATSAGNAQQFNILVDFNLDNNQFLNRSNIQLADTAEFKWISLRQHPSIRTFDLSVTFMGTDSDDTIPCYIAPNQKFSATLWFRKKEKLTRDLRVLAELVDIQDIVKWFKLKYEREHKKEDEDQEKHKEGGNVIPLNIRSDGMPTILNSYQFDEDQRYPTDRNLKTLFPQKGILRRYHQPKRS